MKGTINTVTGKESVQREGKTDKERISERNIFMYVCRRAWIIVLIIQRGAADA